MAEPQLRAQYHSRMLPQGMCVWDIRRLVELSRSLAIERVPLSAIRELDEPYWDGDNDQRLTCRDVAAHARLISECDLSFPVILSSDGRVMDGMHRVCKALSFAILSRIISASRLTICPTMIDTMGRGLPVN
jgi:hypothetical protein